MPDYRPILTEKESSRVDELMALLQKIYSKEEEVKKELRKLIYKTESGR